jgi:transketolase
VLEHTRELVARGKVAQEEWQTAFDAWAADHPEEKALFDRMQTRTLPEGWDADLPTFDADPKGVATRKASGAVINAIAEKVPEFWGGSADLAESNNTTIEGAPSFLPADRSTKMWAGDPYAGRVLHFGIREHGMGAILNGIAVHGGTRVFGGTFLTFSDYMRPSVRLAAIMGLPVTYVWTHDSVGLGEDGPTHQPIEHFAALRAIPGLDFVRPGDANEVTACWKAILEHTDRPAGLALSRQNLPVFPRGSEGFSDTSNVHRGGYVLQDTDGTPDVVLIGTGSELQLAVEARKILAEDGVAARVVSMPCREWFDEQESSYRETVVPPTVKARVSVEAGIAQGWREVVGDHGRIVSIEHYGASADYQRIFTEFGVTAAAVADAARDSIHVATG